MKKYELRLTVGECRAILAALRLRHELSLISEFQDWDESARSKIEHELRLLGEVP